MFGLDKFQPYFYPGHVTVMTDHGNLRWLMAHQQKGRLARWQLLLQMYDFTISYVKGVNNPVADVLSRDAIPKTEALQVNAYDLRARKPKTHTHQEEVEAEDSMEIDYITTALVAPLVQYDWDVEQSKDPFLISRIAKEITGFEKQDGIIYRKHRDTAKRKICVPEHLIEKVISQVHTASEVAHGGRQQTSYHLRKYWFPSFRKRIGQFCKNCLMCVKIKGIGESHNVLHTREPAAVLDRVFIDIVGPLQNDMDSYRNDAKYILTMMDDGSRFLRTVALRSRRAETTMKAFLDNWVGIFGPPKEIICDDDKSFGGKSLALFLQRYGCIVQTTAPYSPEMNAVERVHKSLMARIRALRYSMDLPWSECLYMATYGYNVTEHSMLQVSPYSLVFSKAKDLSGKDVIIENITQARDEAMQTAVALRSKSLDKMNKRRRPQDIDVGDTVYVANLSASKLEDRVLDIPFIVKAIIGTNSKKFELQGPDNVMLIRARKHIWKRQY